MGLRETKKENTRWQLLEAALQLIGRQGFGATTIPQIAAAVDVSPRTVLRYFPTKEDVIVSWVEDGMALFLSTLEARPADEPGHLSLLASARAMLRSYQERAEFYLTIERVIASVPAISARKQELSSVLGERVSRILAQRSPSPAGWAEDLYPAIVFSMLRVVIHRWVDLDGSRPLVDLFDEASALVQFQPR